ncbi:MAG: alpha/beta fold hydrolase [Alphaproteobacteria bacterium]
MNDSTVNAALQHWAPRLVANGVPLTDFQEVTSAITSWDEWCGAWCARARIHEEMGRDALAVGRTLSAAEHLTTASVCYHFGKFLFVHDVPQMRDAHDRAVDCHSTALPYMCPAGERVEIPYEDTTLKANLRKPPEVDHPPVLIMCVGLDSTKEEMDAYARPFLERGIAALAFDGPGQGEAEYDLPIRGDFETPVAAVLDWIDVRADLDSDRVGIWGVSLGGYYAPRAAAFHDRIRGCISLTGPFDWSEAWETLPELTRAAFVARSHSASAEEARRKASTLSLRGVVSNIRCPMFVVAGKLDRVIPWDHPRRIAEGASGPVEFLALEDAGHVANNRTYRYRLQSADWMAEVLENGGR